MSLVLLLFGLFSINNVFAGPVIADISNSSGDYYFLTNDGNDQKQISCNNSAGCYIECIDAYSCNTASISAHSSTWLILKCNALNSCDTLYLSDGPTQSANIECISSSGYSCHSAIFILHTTNTINLYCSTNTIVSQAGSCYDIKLNASNAKQVNINCLGKYDCSYTDIYVDSVSISTIINGYGKYALNYAQIYAANSTKLEINCYDYYSCSFTDIYAPYNDEYIFAMYCISIPYSCSAVDIIIPQSTASTNNYMQLVCPRTDIFAAACNIRWKCLDLSTSTSTLTEYVADYSLYDCNDQDCCPWTDSNDIVQNNVVTLPNSVQPNIANSSGEWYILHDSVSNKLISCANAISCYVECIGVNSCEGATIYAGSTNYLSLSCIAQSSCSQLYIDEGPINQVDIYCISELGSSCYNAAFILTKTKSVNIECSTGTTDWPNDGSCYDLSLWASDSQVVNINCVGNFDCSYSAFHLESVSQKISINADSYKALYYTKIFAKYSNKLEIGCNADYACNFLDIEPPFNDEYVFKLYCKSIEYSCSTVDIIVPQSTGFSNNYMQLICPRTDNITGCCSIRWYCLDISLSTSTLTTFNVINSRYQCNDNDCCPWINPNEMTQPPTTTTLSPTNYPSINPVFNTPNVTNITNINITNVTVTLNTTSLTSTTFISTQDHEKESSAIDIFGLKFNSLELTIIIGIACAVFISLIFLLIYCLKKGQKGKEKESILINHAMVILIAIGYYDQHPQDADLGLQNVFLNDLEVEKDIKNLTKLFGAEYLNYTIYPTYSEYENYKTAKLHWSEREIIDLLQDKADELEDNLSLFDALIVVLSGHGMKDHICTSDYKLIQKTAIHRIFSQNHPKSREIPRIFLFDCCEGNNEHGKVIKSIRTRMDKQLEQDLDDEDENDDEDGILDVGKNFTLSDIPRENSSIWAYNTKNPDFKLIEINAANPGFQSKLNSLIGSYMIYEFVSRAMDDLNNNKSQCIGDIFDEIQNELEKRGKQQTKNIYNNNTRYIKLKRNKNKKIVRNLETI